ncbi:hypothetical protein [Simiduia aestuariiviva]|uniref:Uncharacterized protein n=1 Tax=Simiduia aestuariiviva TaxID=1510459 RepID=A0A839UJG2_9GAMM|nr:hypothetical protein [Simiduia aestuariiviva]MBB3167713.1 hypothetical protein [Simiduia aestuariiviva]
MNAQLPRVAPALGSTSTGLSPYFKSGAGTRVMVANDQRQILDAMYAMAAKPSSEGYHALSMTKAVDRLRAGGDLPNAQYQPHRPNRRCLVHSGFEIEYEVVPGVFGQGAIEILAIRLTRRDAKKTERAGMWAVESAKSASGPEWVAKTWLPDLSSVSKQSSLKIGVNGYFEDIEEAARYMPSHICKGSPKKEAELKKSGYHLFYSPVPGLLKSGWQSIMNSALVHTNAGKQKEASILTAYMQDAHERELNIEWTSHRGGSYVLTEAMKLLAKKQMDLKGKQSIFLSDNTSSHAVADSYRRKLNMDIAEPNWFNKGFGIGQMAGGSLFGVAEIQTGLTVLRKDTPADKVPGKGLQWVNDLGMTATKNYGSLAGASLLWGQFGIGAAGLVVAYQLLKIGAKCVPSLTNEYHTRKDQAESELLNKVYAKMNSGAK